MEEEYLEDGQWDETREDNETPVQQKKSNVLPLWGNERSMNLNPLILTNIQSSHYFKVNLYELKTYHEVIDEIYYKVNHLEPWEKGSRKTAGQTGMCGGVRGVGAGGIVSTAFCLLYKLFTLKLTRKQVIGLITHPDSPYIRVLGFMYIRYTQPPADLWDWYEAYLEDEEELDVKAGGGQMMSIGNILKNFLCKLEWYSTLFPRIPVPIQMKLEKKMNERFPQTAQNNTRNNGNAPSNDVNNDNTQRKGNDVRTGNRYAGRNNGDYQRNSNKDYEEGEWANKDNTDRNRNDRSSSRINDSYRSRSNNNEQRRLDSRRISPRTDDAYNRNRYRRSAGEIERHERIERRNNEEAYYRKRERSRDDEERKYKKDRSSRNEYDERIVEKEIRREHKKSRSDKKHKRDKSREKIRDNERRDQSKHSRSKHHY